MDPINDGIVRMQDPQATTRIGLPGLLALVFTLSWLGAAPIVLATWLDGNSPAALRSLADTLAPLQWLMFFGALLGVLIATAANQGGRGLAAWLLSLVRPRAGAGWYLAVLAGPSLVMIFGSFAGRWLDPALPPFALNGTALLGVLQVLGVYLLLNTEEFAWRGYVLPRLQSRFAPLQANLLLAVIWGLFHSPYFMMKGGHPGGYGVLEFAVMVVAICLVMGAVFNATRGSVLVCHLLHQSINAWSEGLRLFPAMNGGSPWPLRIAVFSMACAGAVAAYWLWRKGRGRDEPAGRASGPRPSVRTLAISGLVAAGAAGAAPGDVDLTFGSGGAAFINGNGNGYDAVHALSALPDGGLLAAGLIDNGFPTSKDLAVVRLDASGRLDPSFGTGGVTLVGLGEDGDAGWAMLRQPDGRILVAGSLEFNAYNDFGVVRLLADGTPDTSFGQDAGLGERTGFARLNTGANEFIHDEARAIARQSDGKLVLAGFTYVTEGDFDRQRLAMARFNANGSVDTDFGAGGTGIVIAPATNPDYDEMTTAVALLPDGTLPADDRITVVGYRVFGAAGIVRRYHADGALDTSLDGDGTLVIPHLDAADNVAGLETIVAAALQPDGKLVIAGTSEDRGFTIMRLHPNGSRDISFGANGRRTVKFSPEGSYDEPAALALQPNGGIVVAGYTTSGAPDHNEDFAVTRLLPDGTPDPSFGNGSGRMTWPLTLRNDRALAVAVDARGRPVAAGVGAPRALDLEDMAFLRLQGDSGPFRDSFED